MKKLMTLFTGLLCLLTTKIFSQEITEGYIRLPDTIIVNLPNSGQMMIRMHSFELNKDLKVVSTSFKSINSNLKLATYVEPVTITYKKGSKESTMEVAPAKEMSTKIMIKGKQILQNMNEVNLSYPNLEVGLNIQSLEELKALETFDFAALMLAIKNDLKHHINPKRERLYATLDYDNNTFSNIETKLHHSLDYIELSTGVGVGLVRDVLTPTLDAKATVTLKNKYGLHKKKFGIGMTQHYFFDKNDDGEYSVQPNIFLTGYFGFNESKTAENPKWTTIGIGYLFKGNGGYFKGYTYKLSLSYLVNKNNFDISPELIFTDNFKSAFPAIRFGLTF